MFAFIITFRSGAILRERSQTKPQILFYQVVVLVLSILNKAIVLVLLKQRLQELPHNNFVSRSLGYANDKHFTT